MNWKKRYESLVKGDTVKVIKHCYSGQCSGDLECGCTFVDYIGTIKEIEGRRINVKFDKCGRNTHTKSCSGFNRECLEKV